MSIFVGMDYKETFILNSIRILFGGLVFAVIYLMFGGSGQYSSVFWERLIMLPVFPLVFLCGYWVLLPVHFAIRFLANNVSEIFIIAAFFLLPFYPIVIIGDPLYFLVGRIFKKIPISPDFGPLNFTVFFKVLRDDAQMVHNVE